MSDAYVHGYGTAESIRLQDQASTLVELLHADTAYPTGSRVLEMGCGVGAQTVPLARRSPDADITAIDISESSLDVARQRTKEAGIENVQFQQGDLFDLAFEADSFDHVFVCFVLEHLAQPLQALTMMKRLLRPGGTMTVIEGDHGSTYFYPESEAAHRAIECQVELQRRAGGDAHVGRRLYPLLQDAGLDAVCVSPRMVYVDASKPDLVEGFIRDTFTAMIRGVREPALDAGLIDATTFDAGIRALERTAAADGVFCYTFFKATATQSD